MGSRSSTAPRFTNMPTRGKASIGTGARSSSTTAAMRSGIPHLERAVLAEEVSHRRPARGCCRVHVVPGLFAQSRRMDSESFGGNENLEAIDLLRSFNELAHTVPGAITIAEESTPFPACRSRSI